MLYYSLILVQPCTAEKDGMIEFRRDSIPLVSFINDFINNPRWIDRYTCLPFYFSPLINLTPDCLFLKVFVFYS